MPVPNDPQKSLIQGAPLKDSSQSTNKGTPIMKRYCLNYMTYNILVIRIIWMHGLTRSTSKMSDLNIHGLFILRKTN